MTDYRKVHVHKRGFSVRASLMKLGESVGIDYPTEILWDNGTEILWDDGTTIYWSNTVNTATRIINVRKRNFTLRAKVNNE